MIPVNRIDDNQDGDSDCRDSNGNAKVSNQLGGSDTAWLLLKHIFLMVEAGQALTPGPLAFF